jgi:hypothetical protein
MGWVSPAGSNPVPVTSMGIRITESFECGFHNIAIKSTSIILTPRSRVFHVPAWWNVNGLLTPQRRKAQADVRTERAHTPFHCILVLSSSLLTLINITSFKVHPCLSSLSYTTQLLVTLPFSDLSTCTSFCLPLCFCISPVQTTICYTLPIS